MNLEAVPAGTEAGPRRPSAGARAAATVLRGYQRWISPALPPTCRFYPTCSAYGIEALQVHGLVRGIWLTARRLLRCAPWHPGGVDPVPPRRETTSSRSRGPSAEDRTTGHARDREEQAPC
ncbi:membrane protein insertion efficiency factor YidD [Pseudonocardia sediminis]|uniref:membrane protein insertion efficiency factor YidD n=1 Tax=Pseudonocardia sediminis TaxID=1397368 RepID=UPI00102A3ECE|nr:membrane protein insertion efficiency factor YidD [Pseudonocardia sediminis]